MGDQGDNKWEKFAQDQSENETSTDDEVMEEEVDDAVSEDGAEAGRAPSDEMAAVTELQNTVKSLQLELEKAKDQMQRAMAEVDNTRRRAERDVSDAHRYGAKKILTEMVAVLDSLMRAQEGVDVSDENLKPMLSGIALTTELFEKALAKFGMVAIDPEHGDAFDPEKHEAMSTAPDEALDKNCIISVLQKGYELNGRVVRAAMVIVSQ
jgi:molecular chaperone GrpE